MKYTAENTRVSFILALIGPLVTLAISPNVSNDPINPIKLLFASTLTFGCIGILLGMFPAILEILGMFRLALVVLFLSSFLIPLLTSSTGFNQQMWGVFGRNTGALNYLILAFALIAASVIRIREFERSFLKGLGVTLAFTVMYCLIQIAQLDPIKWSFYAPFATLGNVNFSSAFLGISFTIIFFQIFNKVEKYRISILLTFSISVIYAIYKTNSIQGFLIIAVGLWCGFLSIIYIRNKKVFWYLSLPITLSLAYFSTLGFFEKGPLARVLYQQTNVFRIDYWHAGWEMFKSSPFTGLGFDSYGDWYTEKRGLISALRTGLVRTSNSAHNIFIDISVNGGILMIASYLAILIVCLVNSLRYVSELARINQIDYQFLGLFCGWVSYLAQSLISINQISVGIWGWIITGMLYRKWNVEEFKLQKQIIKNASTSDNQKTSVKKKHTKKQLNAGSAVLGLVFTVMGFAIAFVPFSADMSFRSASTNRDLNQMIAATEKTGATSFAIAETAKAALQNNFRDPAIKLTEKLIREYPRDQFAWKVRAQLDELSLAERQRAMTQLQKLEPYFACASADPALGFRKWIFQIPNSQQIELAKWWGLLPWNFEGESFEFANLDSNILDARLRQLCG